ncbi:hypothetical protein ABZ519_25875 [Streptomyces collinus]|uniref:hypothetical protein n=1 Tax=Streptomyces collinus TaxID=42684 RepID=UPI00340305E6
MDLPSGKVKVTSEQPLDPAAVAAAVDEARYELVGGESRWSGGRSCCAGPSAPVARLTAAAFSGPRTRLTKP